MKKVVLPSFVICLLALVFSSCHCRKKTSSGVSTTVQTEIPKAPSDTLSEEELSKIREQQKQYANEGYSRARVIYNEVDGCGYMIQLGDGSKLEPTNLKEEFKKDKLDVWVKYIEKKGGMSICMAGQMADITDIQLRR